MSHIHVYSTPTAQRVEVSDALRVFLNGVCDNLMDSEEIQRALIYEMAKKKLREKNTNNVDFTH
ncbi:hypothetical protein NECAME_04427 [Necator americanus]|uniref:Uncharacterized protein n=1 Tax=Necator americanus TaxID=51031 RepID=W2SSV5_NECAM|nr:hypothetical protein NECAME_04427 [Necator americanus]ETN72819.1 hypothetical protein NECAME_04427 [Necator americanus]